MQKEEKLKASSLIQIKTLLKAKNDKTNGTEIIFKVTASSICKQIHPPVNQKKKHFFEVDLVQTATSA